jgi:HD-GYP domain-containing protein (c-di-GMP phosphodiesterase class II)
MPTDSSHRPEDGPTAASSVRELAHALERANTLRRGGQRGEAVRLLQRVLEREPSSMRAYELLADTLMEEGRYGEAVACWERLLEIEPGYERALAGVERALEARSSRLNARNGWRASARAAGWNVSGSPRPTEPRPALPRLESSNGAGAPAPEEAGAAAEETKQASGSESESSQPSGGTDVSDATLGVADLLMGLFEYRDPYFRGNASQTRLVAAALSRRLGVSDTETRELELAAVLRDLGQFPLHGVLSQVGSTLPDEARRQVERHTDVTLALLEGTGLPQAVRQAIRHHHERWDGTGYPDRLAGPAIPLGARILAVADAFSAMIAARPHRLPRSTGAALTELRTAAGSHFDPAIVDALVGLVSTSSWDGPGFGLRQHIVVVDPDEVRAVVAANRLCARGYLAEAAFSTFGAMARLNRGRVSPVSAVVVSAELPRETLLGLMREVRETSATAFTPILVTHAPRTQRLALMQAGADLVLESDAALDEMLTGLGALLRRERATDQARQTAGWDRRVPGLQGNLQDFPLSWLLQVLHYDGRTAAVFITAEQDEGSIYLDRGDPRMAHTRELTGEAALRAMLRWRNGSFLVDPDAETEHRTISRPLMGLLLEEAVVDDHSAYFNAHVFGRKAGGDTA